MIRDTVARHGALWAQWYLLGRRDEANVFHHVAEGKSLLALVGVAFP